MPETVPAEFVLWHGDLPIPWQSVTGGSGSVAGASSSRVATAPSGGWFPREFLLPAWFLAVSEHVPFPSSAWWYRLRVPDLHPAGGHDISEVGGTGGAQWPHHTV